MTKTTPKLLPCPFCGSTDLHRCEIWISGDDGEQIFDGIECNGCDAQVRASSWNMRPTATRWVSVDQRLPDSGWPVIVFAKDGTLEMRIRAQYAASFTLEVGCDDPGDFGEYCEKRDEYFCPEGWYETNEHEDTHWAVSGIVTHWMPLPEAPNRILIDARPGLAAPGNGGFLSTTWKAKNMHVTVKQNLDGTYTAFLAHNGRKYICEAERPHEAYVGAVNMALARDLR